MAVSTFDLFKIGIGPSSSHTVGPMRAGVMFGERLGDAGQLQHVARLRCELFGSLAFTGRGHGTDKAVILGLSGELPDQIDPDRIDGILTSIQAAGTLNLLGQQAVGFDAKTDLVFNKRESLPHHSNGMRFSAFDDSDQLLQSRDYYSVGGGFVVNQDEAAADQIVADTTKLPYPFSMSIDLLRLCRKHGLTIAQIMWENEQAWRSRAEIETGLRKIWQAMQDCVKRGIGTEGTLPGGLHVKRRASELHAVLAANASEADGAADPLEIMDWVNLFALAVNEENAAGGRVVTAPTNGAAGIVPAVLHYYVKFCQGDESGVFDFLLTAAAIAILYKENASISGAEVGCQGEVGVACSMAAGALTAALGGSTAQVENAAEIGMEHNLGLTCDPVAGLVQVPCIERNAMGAIKAINAQRLAMRGAGKHRVPLDKVIKTMRDTGADMQAKYKETSRGGLAVNVIEC